MNKKFYGTLLLGTLLLGSTIVSCKDYDDDIDNLQNQITQLATKADMQSEVSKLQSAVATAQAAAENKAAAAEQAAKDAAAKAQAAADAAAKAQGTADAAATVEALNKVAADAAAAAKAAEDAKAAAEAKAAELEAQLAELQALAATLVSTKDFEAAKKELNDKYAELAAKIGETTGTTGLTGINVVNGVTISAGYGVWAGVHNNMQAAEWDGPKAKEINAIEKGTKLAAWGAKDITFSVNPTDFDATTIESFAIVNQFDEVAPIAFGTPKAVTRAAAGAWTLPILGNVIYGEKAADFQKSFIIDPVTGKNGTVATLAAAQFAGAISDNFCSVTANENTSVSTFFANVPFDKIDGKVELEAGSASEVFDAYITRISEKLDANIPHDSVVYKLAYTGTTLTYDAAAVKKFMADKNANQTLKLKVKQINLNGYIHEVEAVVTFGYKAKPDPIKAEPIQLDQAVPHTIVPVYWNRSTGKAVNNQNVSISLIPVLNKWGIDFANKKDSATIHWNHTVVSSVKVAEAYYLDTDNTPVYLEDFAGAAVVDDDNKNHKAKLTITFEQNYTYNNVKNVNNAEDKNSDGKIDNTEDGIDAAFNGKLIYVTVTFQGSDTDNGEEIVTDYKVVVPVQFSKINASDYLTWGEAKDRKVLATTFFAGDFNVSDRLKSKYKTVNANGTEIGTEEVVKIAAPKFDVVDKNGNVTDELDKVKYVRPTVTISGQLETKAYKDAYKQKEDAGWDEDTKASDIRELKREYQNYVTLRTGGVFHASIEVGSTTKQNIWVATEQSGISTNCITPTAITYTTTQTAVFVKPLRNLIANLPDDMKNGNYKVDYMWVTIMGRDVKVEGPEFEVYTTPAPATATMTTTAKLRSGVTYLYNSAIPAENTGNYDGAFTLTNADGKTMRVAGLDNTSIAEVQFVKVIKANGSESTTVPTGSLSVKTKTYVVNSTANTKANGLAIDNRYGGLESGDKLVLKLKINSYVHNLQTHENAAEVLYENVVLEIK